VNGKQGKFQAVINSQFVEDVGHVVLDRVLADQKLPGNFLV
jgi:hypothetical protein